MDLLTARVHTGFMPTTIPPSGAVIDTDTPVRDAAQRLRNTFRLNATTSTLGGVTALVAAGPLNSLLGTTSPGWVRAIGAALSVFAIVVGVLAGRSIRRLIRYTPDVIAADASWVAASAAAVLAGWFSTAGNVVVGGVAAMVATFACRQFVTG
jgi:hypothetical protein